MRHTRRIGIVLAVACCLVFGALGGSLLSAGAATTGTSSTTTYPEHDHARRRWRRSGLQRGRVPRGRRERSTRGRRERRHRGLRPRSRPLRRPRRRAAHLRDAAGVVGDVGRPGPAPRSGDAQRGRVSRCAMMVRWNRPRHAAGGAGSSRRAGDPRRGHRPLDDPLGLRGRGAGGETDSSWRARFRDDDGRVWRAAPGARGEPAAAWAPAKPGTGPFAALRSLHPVAIELRLEAADGRSAARTVTRRLLADGVQVRTLAGRPRRPALPPRRHPASALVIDATSGAGHDAVATPAAALLASRGVLVLAVGPGRGKTTPAAMLAEARERLAALPAAAGTPVTVLPALELAAAAGPPGDGVVLPPGIPATDTAEQAATRAQAWDALLARLAATPRGTPAAEPPARRRDRSPASPPERRVHSAEFEDSGGAGS